MKIALASLLVASVATAQPACPTKGTPIFEIDHDAIKDAKLPTSQLQIWDSGGWKLTGTDEAGKAIAPKQGCLDAAARDKLVAALKAAPWKITHNKIHCMMVSQTFTAYKMNGKDVWTAKACSPDALDDASAKAIADVEKLLVDAKVSEK
jgi:hypothetical protein